MQRIYFTVTNDLTYDQRMIRICTSLANAGYDVFLVGVKFKNSVPLISENFKQKRISCFFKTGKFFYAEYNIRLFIFLLFKKMNAICAIDLDSILTGLYISKIKNIPRVYDAHELFCEMKEIATRPGIYRVWKKIERHAVPQFKFCYTVNQTIANEFFRLYKTHFEVIRNIAVWRQQENNVVREPYILYQGAVNEGRSFETLIPAMKNVAARLMIAGNGNFLQNAKTLVRENGLEEKIIFTGKIPPEQLRLYTGKALIGITLFENNGLNNYFSLANRFFDYIQSYTPQLCVGYPIYKTINDEYGVAVLVDDLSPENLARELNSLLSDTNKWKHLNENCVKAAKVLNWQNEEKRLIRFYETIFTSPYI